MSKKCQLLDKIRLFNKSLKLSVNLRIDKLYSGSLVSTYNNQLNSWLTT